MTLQSNPCRQLSRLEDECRQIQRQLEIVERQIIRRMTAQIPNLLPRPTHYRQGKAPNPRAFRERYRSQRAALTAERQPEIDALSHRLAQQERAITLLVEQHGGTAAVSHLSHATPIRGVDAKSV